MTLDDITQATDKLNTELPDICKVQPRQIGVPFFTGWKGDYSAQHLSLETNNKIIAELSGPEALNYVGQWIYYADLDGPFYYVNVPGMEHGRYQKGDSFDIGWIRVKTTTSLERRCLLIIEGRELMRQLIGK